MKPRPAAPAGHLLDDALHPFGLTVLGCARVTADERPADYPGQDATPWVILIGQAGSSIWPAFSRSREYTEAIGAGHSADAHLQAGPLDRWSARVAGPIARAFDAHALFPFTGPPFHPFQRWALRAGAVQASPLGLLLHERYGSWFAYRFALLCEHLPAGCRSSAAASSMALHAGCQHCHEQPCLSACPVDAITPEGPKPLACASHLHTPAGQYCLQQGCQARLACPVGQPYRYQPEHRRFHMQAQAHALPVAALQQNNSAPASCA